MEAEKLLTVKEICEKYDITRKTLFYYDKAGLLSPDRRVGTQLHKVYDSDEIRKLETILQYRNAGLTIGEIRELTDFSTERDDHIRILENARNRLLREEQKKQEEIRNLDIIIDELKNGKQAVN